MRDAEVRRGAMRLYPSDSDAVLSPCGTYRYRLRRTWNASAGSMVWVMLNPSTADASQDDPTIRRCRSFAEAWGCGGMEVVNLFAWRATNPRELMVPGRDVVGPDNDRHILEAAQAHPLVVCAWGANGEGPRGDRVRAMLRDAGIPLHYLRLTKRGQPQHPLYLPGSLQPTRWSDAL